MKNIIVFDNGGETFDRFTIIDRKSGDMIGSSENPFHPQGFGQYCGNPAHTFFAQTIGAGYISRLSHEDPKHYAKIIRLKTAEIIKEFTRERHIGNVVEFATLPEDVQQFIKQSFEPVNA